MRFTRYNDWNFEITYQTLGIIIVPKSVSKNTLPYADQSNL